MELIAIADFGPCLTPDLIGDGGIEIFTATQAMGQGIVTSYAQLAVDIFQVPIEKIRIVQGDTDRGSGFGSAGSRSLFTGAGLAPYTALEEAATTWRTPCLRHASSTCRVPVTLTSWHRMGSAMDWGTLAIAARWTTASTPSRSSPHRVRSWSTRACWSP